MDRFTVGVHVKAIVNVEISATDAQEAAKLIAEKVKDSGAGIIATGYDLFDGKARIASVTNDSLYEQVNT